jgi:hypothetical protein
VYEAGETLETQEWPIGARWSVATSLTIPCRLPMFAARAREPGVEAASFRLQHRRVMIHY